MIVASMRLPCSKHSFIPWLGQVGLPLHQSLTPYVHPTFTRHAHPPGSESRLFWQAQGPAGGGFGEGGGGEGEGGGGRQQELPQQPLIASSNILPFPHEESASVGHLGSYIHQSGLANAQPTATRHEQEPPPEPPCWQEHVAGGEGEGGGGGGGGGLQVLVIQQPMGCNFRAGRSAPASASTADGATCSSCGVPTVSASRGRRATEPASNTSLGKAARGGEGGAVVASSRDRRDGADGGGGGGAGGIEGGAGGQSVVVLARMHTPSSGSVKFAQRHGR